MPITLDEAIERYKVGIEYLKSTGFDLYMFEVFASVVFKPGSFFEDSSEILPQPYKHKAGTVSLEFMKRYNVTTEVDLHRMARICSIILTNFNGPKDQDDPKNHRERLRNRFSTESNKEECEVHMVQAFLILDRIMGLEKALPIQDLYEVVRVLGSVFSFW